MEGKEEALQCEGGCNLWFHRYCAGVSVSYFAELSNSPEPFLCYACYQRSQLAATKVLQSEVAQLKGEIKNLSQELANLKLTTTSPQALGQATVSHSFTSSNTNKTTINSNGPAYASILKPADNPANPATSNTLPQPTSNKPPGARLNRNNSVDKKFNIVIYGPRECPKGSPWHERASHDTNLACKIIKSICPDLHDYAICDCSRIGKYSEQRTRPLSVKFSRSCDVAMVLSNRHKISKAEYPKIFIKPFMSIAERITESTLLKEGRTLIDSGIERKLIRIRGNSIYINKTKVGSANINKGNFVRHQQPLDQSPESIPTNNILSANAASNAASLDVSPNIPDNVGSSNEVQSQRLQSPERPRSSSPLPSNSN